MRRKEAEEVMAEKMTAGKGGEKNVEYKEFENRQGQPDKLHVHKA